MTARNLKMAVSDKYVKAFIEVAEMLEPNVEFNNIIDQTYAKGCGSVDREVCVSGVINDTLVMVSKEQHPTKGLQIVVTYTDTETCKVLNRRSMWYFSFNWKGLMATAE